MYNKEKFAELLEKAQGKNSLNKFAEKAKISSAYLSKLKRGLQDGPPSPKIIQQISESTPDVSYLEFMEAAGHISSVEDESRKISAKLKYLSKNNPYYVALHPDIVQETSILTEEEKRELDNFSKTSEPKDIFRFVNDMNKLRLGNFEMIGTESEWSTEKQSGIYIPHYGNVAAGALFTIDGVHVDNVDYIHIPLQFLGKHTTSDNLFAVTADGESMNKIIQNGSIVIAKQIDKLEYKDGDIVIFEHDGEYSLKRYSPQDIDGFLLFKAESTDTGIKDIAIPQNTEQDLKIYGKVVFYTTILD